MSKPAQSPVSKCSTSYPRRLKRAYSAWHEMGDVGRVGDEVRLLQFYVSGEKVVVEV